MFAFENFPVYKLSEAFFEEVQDILHSTFEKSLKDQLFRASTSIILNIAEGAGKHSYKEKKTFYVTARGSTHECVSIIRILKIQKVINDQKFDDLHAKLTTISKMLSGLINKMLA